MAIDSTKPTPTEEVSSHAAYIRENRREINALTITSAFDQTDLTVTAGTVGLIVGTDLSAAVVDVVNIDADAAVTLATITAGTAGMIKIFIAEDDDITWTNNAVDTTGNVIRLNQVPAAGSYTMSEGDILVLCNIGGSDGYWKELYRTLFVG